MGVLTSSRNRQRAPAPEARPGTAARGRAETRAGLGFIAPSLAGFLVFTLVPIAGSLVMSLFDWPLIGQPSFSGLANWARILQDPVFAIAARNTLLFVVLYMPLNMVVALGLAVWIAGQRRRLRNFYRVLFFLPTVVPMVANAVVWSLMLQPRGVIDATMQSLFGVSAPNFLGSTTWAMPAVILMSVWQGFGYNLLVFSAGLDAIPRQLYEAAELDGAGWARRFRSISLPLLTPSLFFAVTMTLITSFQVFAQPYVLTGGGPGASTQTLVLYLYESGFRGYELGYAATIGWCLFLVVMTVTALQFIGQRRWVHYG